MLIELTPFTKATGYQSANFILRLRTRFSKIRRRLMQQELLMGYLLHLTWVLTVTELRLTWQITLACVHPDLAISRD